ncbi:hypothetical protein D6T63_13800 [Arthrobacter cheniae]|uniref:Uncharacterized protein n=1 Tax=Arthrobacter cheniae TaxID=1258888 RepID=A0A3A5M4U6_9MICC|nr:hypothetical protein [Arthrobacter cheniae]RJT78018.1 hypothetical protein D6T63_13800 [Arthrobacter cheniae]
MDQPTQDLGLFVSGNEVAVVGETDVVQRFMNELAVRPELGQKAKRPTIEAVAAATGLSTLAGSSLGGTTFTMTADSAELLKKYSQFNPDGPVAGIIRGAKGRIASTAKFEPAQMNPMVVSNVAALSAAAALKAALADLEQLVEAMDIKLDRLLSDNRAQALGNVQGVTLVLEKAYALYQETNRISETTWAQVSTHSTVLGQSTSYALNQLDAIADSLSKGSTAERSDAITLASGTELQTWLVLLAACQANQERFDALEIAHVTKSEPEEVSAHMQAISAAAERRRTLTALRLQRLNDAVSATADIHDLARVITPLRARSTLNAAESIQSVVATFAGIYGLEGLVYGAVERESWRKSLTDLTAQTRQLVGSAASSVPGAVGKAKPQVQKLRDIELSRPKWTKRTKDKKPKELDAPEEQQAINPLRDTP